MYKRTFGILSLLLVLVRSPGNTVNAVRCWVEDLQC